eukprot:2932353-Alexandrium_andersonii.AAC.1
MDGCVCACVPGPPGPWVHWQGGGALVPVESDSDADRSEEFEPGMPDDWEPPEWGHAEFAGEGAAAG